MQIIAHRGGAGLAPENTWAALIAAERWGVAVECDARTTVDGVVLLRHAAHADWGGWPAAIASRSAAEWAAVPMADGQPMPALTAVFAALQVPVWVDVKDRRTLGAVWQLLMANPSWIPRTTVLYRDPDALGAVVDSVPGLTGCWLTWRAPRRPVPALWGVAVPRWVVRPDRVAAWRALGWQTVVWTINDRAAMIRLQSQGVQGIITDWPDRALRVLAAAPQSSMSPPDHHR